MTQLKSIISQLFGFLQSIGKSLMLPVSILPVAGLLLGIGGAFLGGIERGALVIDSQWLVILFQIMKSSGEPIFASLPLIFAIGVALGVSKNDGVAALASVVGFVVLLGTMGVMATLNGLTPKPILGIASMDTGVFGGILIGLMAGLLFNKFYKISLPSYLGFFSGKRFVPIVTAFSAIALGVALSFIWPPVQSVIDGFSDFAVNGNPSLAVFFYGLVERALLPFGLHHIWNVPFFFEIGEYVNSSGQTITGEMSRFFAGDPTAGNLGGGYLFKMFGLPAAAIAIWRTAKPEKRDDIRNIMLSAALTSFLTGITEPIEFAFLFVAPLLYGVHAILAGLSFVLLQVLGAKLGYTFSHGFIDYVLFYAMGTKSWLVLVLGPLFFALYYFVFKLVIVKFNLKTPGRDSISTNTSPITKPEIINRDASIKPQPIIPADSMSTELSPSYQQASAVLNAFGGFNNISDLDACITRLRIQVREVAQVDKSKLEGLGAAGVLVLGNSVQAIFGTQSEILKTNILELRSNQNPTPTQTITSTVAAEVPTKESIATTSKLIAKVKSAGYLDQLMVAAGGYQNILALAPCASTRIRMEFENKDMTQKGELDRLNWVHISHNVWHLIIGEKTASEN